MLEAPAFTVHPDSPADHARGVGAFADRSHLMRYWVILTVLVAVSLLSTAGILTWENPMPVGSEGFWIIARMRAVDVVVMVFATCCHAFATVAFQTATANRIITPSILGFEALYRAIQTSFIYFMGATVGAVAATSATAFFSQLALMVVLSALLYGWLLSGRFGNLHLMLLVGVVIGGGLGSLATFMQRMLTPSEFDVLQARLMGNISNARDEFLPFVIPLTLIMCSVIWHQARRLNVLAMGRETATNLGLNHRREVMTVLFCVSVLMAMTTSVVGPMTFLGFLTATIAYQLCDTHDHRYILPMAALIGYAVLSSAYFVLRHVFYAQGAVTIIIELVGGITFLVVILRKGRL